jgi:hypothetical protein
MTATLTGRRRQTYAVLAGLLFLGFVCQVLVLDRWMSPVEAAGSPHDSPAQFCQGSLSNCSGTVDVGSSLHAQLTPPIPPETVPGELYLAVPVPPAVTPVHADPPPRSI